MGGLASFSALSIASVLMITVYMSAPLPILCPPPSAPLPSSTKFHLFPTHTTKNTSRKHPQQGSHPQTNTRAALSRFGPVSGAHFNPAVTIAIIQAGKIDWALGSVYIAVQSVAGILGEHRFPGIASQDIEAVVLFGTFFCFWRRASTWCPVNSASSSRRTYP